MTNINELGCESVTEQINFLSSDYVDESEVNNSIGAIFRPNFQVYTK